MDARAPSVSGRLGPYRLLHVIGGGGMGVVHLALDPSERAVAVKVLRPHLAADPGARERLAREVEVLRRVRSPRVAEVLDADPSGEQPYIVTQFVPAPPLDAHVAASGPLAGPDLARLALGLGDALAAIHGAGVVHRDLKPANVLLRDGEVVVIDFGIAQIADDVRLTSTGLVMGTPGYLSPEVLDGDALTTSADWWGWAATVAFAATGRPPFGGGPTESVLSRVRRGVADLDGAPAPLIGVLRAALAPDPSRRPRPRHLREAVQALTSGSWDESTRGDASTQVIAQGQAPGPVRERSNILPFRTTGPTPAVTAASGSQVPTPAMPAARSEPRTVALGGGTNETVVLPGAGAHTVPLGPVASPAPGQRAPMSSPTRPVAVPSWAPGIATADTRTGWEADEASGPRGADRTRPLDVAEREPRTSRRVASSGLLVAVLAALVASAAVAPGAVVVVLVGGLVLARTVDRGREAVLRRRRRRGPRGSDAVVTALAVPGHLVASAVVTIPFLLLPTAMAVSAAFLVGWAIAPGAGLGAGGHVPLAAGGLSALLTAWWGPGSAAVRRGSRACVDAVAAGRRTGLGALVLLVLVALAALLVANTQVAPDWTPLPQTW